MGNKSAPVGVLKVCCLCADAFEPGAKDINSKSNIVLMAH
jgi:hypothetical protein